MVYGISTWILIGLFALLALSHVVMTVLFYVDVVDQGFGYIFGFEWASWLITLLDGLSAVMLWFAYRRGAEAPWLGFDTDPCSVGHNMRSGSVDGVRSRPDGDHNCRFRGSYHYCSTNSPRPHITGHFGFQRGVALQRST
jgi:hypothetical protein